MSADTNPGFPPTPCPELGGCENRAQCWEPCGFLGKSAANARPASAETTAAVNAALTTQPAGALPEPPAYWIPKAEQFCIPSKSGDRPFATAWEPLYTADTVRAMMAERDAAREERDFKRSHNAQLRGEVVKLIIERDALRRELEELRSQKAVATLWREPDQALYPGPVWRLTAEGEALPPGATHTLYAHPIPPDAPDCTDGDGHVYAAVSKAHATPEQNAAVEASIERVAAFAREGREPLTLDNAPLGTRAPAIMGGAWCKVAGGWKWNGPSGLGGTFPRPGGDWTGELRTAREFLGIGPAGTSADGETQP